MGVHFEHSWLHLQKVNITVRLDYHCSGNKPALFPPKKRSSVLLEDRESGKNQAYITVGHVRENKKIIHFLFRGLLGRWIGPYKLNQILLCPISHSFLFQLATTSTSCPSADQYWNGTSCTSCTKCGPGYGVKTKCSEKQDTECQECWPGYDWSNNTSMEPCI